MRERLYLNAQVKAAGFWAELREEVEQCDRCSASEPVLLSTSGSVSIDGADDRSYSCSFDAYFYRGENGNVFFEYLFDEYEWHVSTPGDYCTCGPDDMAALYALVGDAGGGSVLGAAIEDAARAACRAACPGIDEYLQGIEAKDARRVNEDAGRIEAIPTWALPALANGDYDDLSEEDTQALDTWVDRQDDINVTVFSCVNFDDEGYYVPADDEEIDSFFESRPAFGLAASCEYVYFPYTTK